MKMVVGDRPFAIKKYKPIDMKDEAGKRLTKEAAVDMTLEQAKAVITAQYPDAFKKAAPKAKAASKKNDDDKANNST